MSIRPVSHAPNSTSGPPLPACMPRGVTPDPRARPRGSGHATRHGLAAGIVLRRSSLRVCACGDPTTGGRLETGDDDAGLRPGDGGCADERADPVPAGSCLRPRPHAHGRAPARPVPVHPPAETPDQDPSRRARIRGPPDDRATRRIDRCRGTGSRGLPARSPSRGRHRFGHRGPAAGPDVGRQGARGEKSGRAGLEDPDQPQGYLRRCRGRAGCPSPAAIPAGASRAPCGLAEMVDPATTARPTLRPAERSSSRRRRAAARIAGMIVHSPAPATPPATT